MIFIYNVHGLERMERGSRRRSSSAGSEKIRESLWQIGKNGRTLFDRPKPTVGCSANGRGMYVDCILKKDNCARMLACVIAVHIQLSCAKQCPI